MRRPVALAAILAVGSALAGPAGAQGAGGAEAPPAPVPGSASCRVLGQMAVSSWLDLLGRLAGGSSQEIDPVLLRLDATTSLYDGLGCDGAVLRGAFDCLLSANAASDSPQQNARACLAEADLAEEG